MRRYTLRNSYKNDGLKSTEIPNKLTSLQYSRIKNALLIKEE